MPLRNQAGRLGGAVLAALVATTGVPAQEPAAAARSFKFSGSHRARYETLEPQFRPGLDRSDQLLALQTSLAFRFDTEHFGAFAEIMDSRGALNDEQSFVNGSVVNTLEPIQAQLAWRRADLFEPGSRSTVRVGRMTLDVGKRRVVARNRYRNTVNNFSGVEWQWQSAGGRGFRVFHVAPMRPLPADLPSLLDNEAELDRAIRGATLSGVFYQLPPLPDDSVVELYMLDFDLDPGAGDPVAAADLATIGTRVFRPPSPGRWTFELEAIGQRGESGGIVAGAPRADVEHRAYFVHLEMGYAFDTSWSPHLALQHDTATGDEDPNDARIERFNTLFGARRFDFGPTGIHGPFARSNIESTGLRITAEPRPRLALMAAYRSFANAEARDGWIGTSWRDPSGASGRSLGRQLEASVTWAAIADRLTVEAGFAAVRMGSFADRVSAGAIGDPVYFYAALTTDF